MRRIFNYFSCKNISVAVNRLIKLSYFLERKYSRPIEDEISCSPNKENHDQLKFWWIGYEKKVYHALAIFYWKSG